MEKTASSFVDRLASHRAWISTVLGPFVAVNSTSIFRFDMGASGLEVTLADGFSAGAWLFWFVILLLFTLFAGGLWLSASLRQRFNDESTAANWRSAVSTGFWAMMIGAAVCMIASSHMALTARGAVQIMTSLGVGMALVRFGGLERRALAV